ncbi:MAG: pyruvate:ferredoxin (flavodoxin) oxidoreductase [Elusimicrobia bacterium]|nr:pyruvate:ferredoxin (flavodoxin) oxidoreductase [Elusimicrobiota bacterium]
MKQIKKAIDGNTAAAHVAYAFSEVAAIYPITPSSPMGELADQWAAEGRKNLFGEKVTVIEMQSEGGASGAVHGSLSGGALTTTFTASQGLMLMIPNLNKIAGEMLPTVFHVSARSLACQSLSIFGDHSDVMAVRNTGFALMAASSVQEVMDLAVVSHLATIEAKVPFINFFDGFRTSHEIHKVSVIPYEVMAELLDMKFVEEFRKRALNPNIPFAKVGAENPDVYFQGRETVNKYYQKTPEIVKKYMKLVGEKIGRKYKLFNYFGDPKAEKIIVAMASGCDTIEETVSYLNKKGEKVGAIKVHLYRPFSVKDFVAEIPGTVKKIAVLDRTKEPGSIGEPLYLDVVAALKDKNIKIVGGRYGLSSKEFTPSMVKAVFDHLDNKCSHDFTVGISDDVTKKSIPVKDEIVSEAEDIVRCKFWGYGSDGTVGANKNAIKIIGDNTDLNAQGYFVYDSKKSGGITISFLRFGKSPIKSPYLPNRFNFIALHKNSYIGRYDILEGIMEGGVFLINSHWRGQQVFENLTQDLQKTIITKKVKVYNLNALKIAEEAGLGTRINTAMLAAFFKISGVLEEKKAIKLLKNAIKKTYEAKGDKVVKMNWDCVDRAVREIEEIKIPGKIEKSAPTPRLIPDDASEFEKNVIEPIMRLKGDTIPVSAMPLDGAVPTGTTKLEKRGIAPYVPRWDSDKCIQCNQCSFVCPHAAIRAKQIEEENLKNAPATFKTVDSKTKNDKNLKYRIQIYIEDCTGCANCVHTCPVAALEMVPIQEEREKGEAANAVFFDNLPDNITDGVKTSTIKGSQFLKPLFEFSGACAGCGEATYIKIATQLFGERMLIANATGCSSIYGGTFPTIPYCKTKEETGPCWANSLFEDNAEYGLGMRIAVNSNRKQLRTNIEKFLKISSDEELRKAFEKNLSLWDKTDEEAKRSSVETRRLLALKKDAKGEEKKILAKISELQNYFVEKSVWCIGGDGWAYDIGYGGLDHVIASGLDINLMVLDSEVYSNTGGQASKATQLGAAAKFAIAGKETKKKDLGLMAMTYGYVYVASCAIGANKQQYLNALIEAEAYKGPSLIICYSPCINHGLDMSKSVQEEKLAVDCGYWPLFRYNPLLAREGKNPFKLESKEPNGKFKEFLSGEVRFSSLKKLFPKRAERLFEEAEKAMLERYNHYKKLATM